jgi:hypothetical protein
VAAVQVKVWDNEGGTVTSWVQALVANTPHGESQAFNVSNIGGTVNPAPALLGLQSFGIVVIPEPSGLLMVVGLGAVMLVASRRLGTRNKPQNAW